MNLLTEEPEPLSPIAGPTPPPRYTSPTVTRQSSYDAHPAGTARPPRHCPGPSVPEHPPRPSHPLPDDRLDVLLPAPRHGRPPSESSQSSGGHPPAPVPSPEAPPPIHPVRRSSNPNRDIVRYSFSPISPTAIILAPIEITGTAERVAAAEYHLEIGANCFLPGTAFVLTIRRGGSADGELVGEIELGNPEHAKRGGTVRVGSTKVWLNKVLKKGAGNHKTSAFSWRNPWSWEFPGRTQLLWNCSDQVKKCHRVSYTGGRDTTPLVASFTPPHTDDKDVVVVSAPGVLEVAAVDCAETMDHIVISAWLLERKRVVDKI